MKYLTLIIEDKLKDNVTDLIHGMEQIKEFTISYVEGHSEQSENSPFLSVKDKVLGYTTCARIEILLEEEYIEDFLTLLNKSEISLNGKNILYWVTTVDNFGRI